MANDFDTIVVYNPLDREIPAVYNSEVYDVIRPGKTSSLPRFVAVLTVKHIIDLCIQLKNPEKPITDPNLRKKYAQEVVRQEVVYKKPEPMARLEKIKEETREFDNDLDRLDSVPQGITNHSEFAEAKAQPEYTPPPAPKPHDDKPLQDKADDLIQQSTPATWPQNPTRDQVLEYGKQVQGMDFEDEKTAQTIQGVDDIEKLKELIGYESDE